MTQKGGQLFKIAKAGDAGTGKEEIADFTGVIKCMDFKYGDAYDSYSFEKIR